MFRTRAVILAQLKMEPLEFKVREALVMQTTDLEQKFRKANMDLNISENQQISLNAFLEIIKLKDIPTYEHSIRVGLKGIEVAKFTHIVEPKALYYPGLLHDVGKILSNPQSLKKTDSFDERDMAEMRKHVLNGYKMLRGIHSFSANVMLCHHEFQGEKSYPRVLPKSDIDYSRGTGAMIAFCGRLLSLIDFYDAATFRRTNKFGTDTTQQKTSEQVKELLLKHTSIS